MKIPIRLIALLAFLLAAAGPAFAQDMEPRAFSPAPVGTTFAALVYGHSEGDLVFDPTMPIEDAEAKVDSVTAGAVYVFGLGGMTARVAAVVPWADGTAKGLVGGESRRRDLTGLGDPRLAASLIFYGAPAMTVEEFAKREHGSVAGASLALTLPLGEYDPDRLINLGTNRWTLKGSLGGSFQRGPWVLELSGAVTLSTDNDDFYGGKRLEQDPIWQLQSHLVRELGRGSWVAFDATWYRGGRTTVDGAPSSIQLENVRLGLTYALPITRTQSLKLAIATGVVTEVGTDFDQIQLAWQMIFPPR